MIKNSIVKVTTMPVQIIRWAFDLSSWQPTEAQILKAFSCIQLEEKERIGRFLFKRDAKASLIGRLLIRKFLAENSDLLYNQIVLKRDNNGKPFVDNETLKGKFKFSVSHHGGVVVFVGQISEIEIGVDVMTVKYQGGKALDNFFHLMSRHFSTHEWSVIKNTHFSDTVKMLQFNRHWALKESYLKAVGTGIFVELGKIEFRIKTKVLCNDNYANDTEFYLNDVKQNDWLFQETLLKSNYVVSVAVQSEKIIDNNPFIFLTLDDILKNAIPVAEKDFSFCREFMNKDEEP